MQNQNKNKSKKNMKIRNNNHDNKSLTNRQITLYTIQQVADLVVRDVFVGDSVAVSENVNDFGA